MKECKIIKELFEQFISSDFMIFPSIGKVNVSSKQGVYIIYSPKDEVLHVGKTDRGKKGLNQRLQNHISNNSSFSKQYLKKNGKELRNGYRFKYLIVPDNRKRTLLEALSTGLLCPTHIGTGEKK